MCCKPRAHRTNYILGICTCTDQSADKQFEVFLLTEPSVADGQRLQYFHCCQGVQGGRAQIGFARGSGGGQMRTD